MSGDGFVVGTASAARLSPIGEGAGLGLFNGATAVAGVAGGAVGGLGAALAPGLTGPVEGGTP